MIANFFILKVMIKGQLSDPLWSGNNRKMAAKSMSEIKILKEQAKRERQMKAAAQAANQAYRCSDEMVFNLERRQPSDQSFLYETIKVALPDFRMFQKALQGKESHKYLGLDSPPSTPEVKDIEFDLQLNGQVNSFRSKANHVNLKKIVDTVKKSNGPVKSKPPNLKMEIKNSQHKIPQQIESILKEMTQGLPSLTDIETPVPGPHQKFAFPQPVKASVKKNPKKSQKQISALKVVRTLSDDMPSTPIVEKPVEIEKILPTLSLKHKRNLSTSSTSSSEGSSSDSSESSDSEDDEKNNLAKGVVLSNESAVLHGKTSPLNNNYILDNDSLNTLVDKTEACLKQTSKENKTTLPLIDNDSDLNFFPLEIEKPISPLDNDGLFDDLGFTSVASVDNFLVDDLLITENNEDEGKPSSTNQDKTNMANISHVKVNEEIESDFGPKSNSFILNNLPKKGLGGLYQKDSRVGLKDGRNKLKSNESKLKSKTIRNDTSGHQVKNKTQLKSAPSHRKRSFSETSNSDEGKFKKKIKAYIVSSKDKIFKKEKKVPDHQHDILKGHTPVLPQCAGDIIKGHTPELFQSKNVIDTLKGHTPELPKLKSDINKPSDLHHTKDTTDKNNTVNTPDYNNSLITPDDNYQNSLVTPYENYHHTDEKPTLTHLNTSHPLIDHLIDEKPPDSVVGDNKQGNEIFDEKPPVNSDIIKDELEHAVELDDITPEPFIENVSDLVNVVNLETEKAIPDMDIEKMCSTNVEVPDIMPPLQVENDDHASRNCFDAIEKLDTLDVIDKCDIPNNLKVTISLDLIHLKDSTKINYKNRISKCNNVVTENGIVEDEEIDVECIESPLKKKLKSAEKQENVIRLNIDNDAAGENGITDLFKNPNSVNDLVVRINLSSLKRIPKKNHKKELKRPRRRPAKKHQPEIPSTLTVVNNSVKLEDQSWDENTSDTSDKIKLEEEEEESQPISDNKSHTLETLIEKKNKRGRPPKVSDGKTPAKITRRKSLDIKKEEEEVDVCHEYDMLRKDSGRDPKRLLSYRKTYSNYRTEGTRRKHQADCLKDPVDRAQTYIEAVLNYVQYLVGLELSAKLTMKQGIDEYMQISTECIRLVDYVVTRYGRKVNPSTNSYDRRFLVLCLRLQSILYLRLYKIKKESTVKYGKVLSEYYKQYKPVGNTGPSPCQQSTNNRGSTGTPSPSSPSPGPSPGGSVASIGSAGSSGSAGDKPTNGNVVNVVTLPTDMHEKSFQYFQYTKYLLHCHRLWDDAEHLTSHCQTFLLKVSRKAGVLSMQSSLLHTVDYVSAGLELIKESPNS